MKKLFVVALLAIAGATSAMAGINPGPNGDSHFEIFRIECPDGFVYEKVILVSNSSSSQDLREFRTYMENTICSD